MSEDNDKRGWFEKVKDWGVWQVMKFPVLVAIVFCLVLVGAVLSLLGLGDKINVGGIIGQLFNGDAGKDPHDVANTPPEDRDADVGEEGEEGFTQQKVHVIKPSGLLDDKSALRVKGSEGTEKVKLPDGVKPADVKEVYEVKPGEFDVVVKSKPEGGATEEDIEAWKDKLNQQN